MIDPIQMLEMQANQTQRFFDGVNESSSRVFNARIQVQNSQLQMANNQAELMERSRMNDAQLMETGQMMAIRAKEMEWKEKEYAFQEKMRPLREREMELGFNARLMAHVDQQIAPQMGDIRSEFAGTILENPALAMDAQNAYTAAIADITEQFQRDPNLNISSAIDAKKQELRGWLGEKKKSLEPKQIKMEIPILGEFQFDDPSEMFKDKSIKDPAQAARVYESFGGTGKEFLRRHDPTYKKMIQSNFERAMITGQMDESFTLFDDDQKKQVMKKAEDLKLEKTLLTVLEERTDQLGKLSGTEEKNKLNAPFIESISKDIQKLQGEILKLRGVDINKEGSPALTEEGKRRAATKQETIELDRASSSYSDIPQDVVQSRYIKDVETEAYNRLTKELKIPFPEKVKGYLDPQNQKAEDSYQRSIFPTSFMMQEGGDYSEKDIIEIAQNEKVKDAILRYLSGEDISTSVKDTQQYKELSTKHRWQKIKRVDDPKFKGSWNRVKDVAEDFYNKPAKDKSTQDKKEEVARLREILPNVLFALAKP